MAVPLALFALVIGLHAQDPVRVTAKLTPESVPVGETTVLEVVVETNGPAPDAIVVPPLPPELSIVSSSDYTQLQLTMPGGRRRTVRRQITLVAREPGRYEIAPIAVRVRGEQYRTGVVTLVVTGSVSARSRSRGPNDEVILRAWLTPDTAYVGEQVTLHGEAMFSTDVRLQLRRAPDYIPPSPSGFWVHDLAGSTAARPRLVGDEMYEVQSFGRAYFPLAPGEYVLAPVRLLYEVRRGFLFAPESHELATDSLRLVVLPLPEEGRPASFTGAVGRFSVRARIEPTEVPAGEAVALVVEVTGEGNIKGLPPPLLPDLDGVRVFPPTEETEIQPDEARVRGVKRFTWVLIPDRPGRLQLPPIEYAYFDPELVAYDVARSSLPALAVGPAAWAGAAETGAATTAVIRATPSGPPRLRWVRTRWFAAVPFLPLAGLAWVLTVRRRASRRPPVPSKRRLRAGRRQRMAEIETLVGGQDTAFFGRLAAAVRTALAEEFALPTLDRAAPADVRSLLEDAGLAAALAGEAAGLLERLERARFEPVPPGPEERRACFAEAMRLLEALEATADGRGHAAPGPGTTASLVLAGLLAFSAAPAAAQAPQGSGLAAFERAVEAYGAGDFAAAAEGFRHFLAAHPEDANAWYNLGSAYFQAGERGRAIWAWLQAARLRPRDGEVMHNLRLAQAGQELLQRALPPVPLSSDETLLAACALWLAGAAALGRAILRRARAAGVAGALLTSLALALVAAWGLPRLRDPIAVVLDGPTPLLAAPVLRAEPLRELDAGSGVRILEERGDWLRVATFDGGQGWLEASRAGRL